jgi:glycosyltransferase involved in cell wall biosynthesis
MGIPVIAGINSGGPSYILRDGGGLLVDISSVNAVKDALVKLTIPDIYNSFSKKARESALKSFSKNNIVNQYLQFYKSII